MSIIIYKQISEPAEKDRWIIRSSLRTS